MTKTVVPHPPEPSTAPDSGAADLAGLDVAAFDALERIGRSLHAKGGDLTATLESVVVAAVQLVQGTRDGGLNLLVGGRFVPQVVFGQAPNELDALQKQLGDGPCIAAARDQALVHVPTIPSDEWPWPEFISLADSLGVRSMLCVPLWVDDSRVGSLSLYGAQPHIYGDHEIRIASLLATQAAIVVADARRAENLRVALASRDVIGQAKGILMERSKLTPEQAFEQLVTISQRANRKLADIAEELTQTGQLPI